MKQSIPLVFSIILIVGSTFYLCSQFGHFKDANISIDLVSEWDDHMKSVREALPADVMVVGYVERADIPNNNAIYDDAEFFMTQYSIAPVVMIKGMKYPWIIGNFGRDVEANDFEPWLIEKLNSFEIQYFGFGIYLINNTPD